MRQRVLQWGLLGAAMQLAITGAANASPAQDILTLECIVEPEMTVELSSAVDGLVNTVSVDKSDHVTKGQVLATLESSVEEAAVALALMRANMQEEIEAKRIQRDLAQSKNERVSELYRKKSIPGFEKDEVAAEAALAELEFKRAHSNQQMAMLESERAVAELALRSIVSPIDGVVVERYVHPGESVKDRPLLKLAKTDPLRVEVLANSELFGLLETGMEAEIIVEGGRTETRHRARVTVVDGLVDAASGTFGIRLSLPNPDNDVVGGLKCSALFNLKSQPKNPDSVH